jgi:hypothetical protein
MQQLDIQTQMEIAKSPWHGCEGKNFAFDTAVMYKRISPLISPTGQEEFVAAEIVICKTCGKIPPFFAEKMGSIPEELKSECKK